MSSIVTFNFVAHSVRVVIIRDEPWFVAADVCAALELPNITMAMKRLDDDEFQAIDFSTLNSIEGRENQTLSNFDPKTINIINESGLYALILTSRKPEAKKFKKWVTSEVLPAIRKTGRYEAKDFLAEELITPAQVAEIRQLAWIIGQSYHITSAGEWAGFALVRENFGVSNAYKLPARKFAEALALLQWAERLSLEFKKRVMTVERKFLKSRFRVCPSELDRLADDTTAGLLLRP